MYIALCLYGQPRRYLDGYKSLITDWLQKFENISFDVFFHTWIDEHNTYYDASNWRNINSNDLLIDKDIIKKLVDLYKPKEYCFDNPINFNQDSYKNNTPYDLSDTNYKNTISNTISQLYSRQRVRDIFLNYVSNENINYDFVIGCRFDFLNQINLNLFEIDNSLIYSSSIITGILQNFFISVSNTENYLKITNIFNNLLKMVNNEELINLMTANGAIPIMGPEQLETMNLIFELKYDMNLFWKLSIRTPELPHFN
jgi:hypothetical protein